MSDFQALPEHLPPGLAHGEGLTEVQVAAARQRHGYNDVVPQAAAGWLVVARDTARDPMPWFLLVTSALFVVLGQLAEALTLVAAMVPLLGMDAWLHRRTLASTAGLASRLASTARTLRDGQWIELPARELVPGDLVEVAPGNYFPADGLLVAGSGLQCDESSLTGESLPVPKAALGPGDANAARPGEQHWGTAGTRLLTGTARVRVLRTGGETRYGEIARSAAEGSQAGTPLQQAIGGLVRVLLAVALVLCVVLAAVRLWQGHGWVDAVLSAVTLAVAALPEEFPVVYTFFLGLGVFRLARSKALVRRAVAVENIGRTSCILSDKTGTMTEGRLRLAHVLPAPGHDAAAVMLAGRLAARADSGDPLDEALHEGGAAGQDARRVAVFPFTEARRRETLVWADAAGSLQACTKGAPESILALCALPPQDLAHWRAQVEQLASGGHKVIAVAQGALPPGAGEEEPDRGLHLAGLLAFEDPVRPGVREAIAGCLAADIRVIMVTGDHPATAAAIAREVGLGGGEPRVHVATPEDSPAAVLARGGLVHVVARATPMQKLAWVRALQAQGEVVAVTGDGVNDVPALREADIGIAMGERGTRAAREAAPIVLLDDNFRTIAAAVAEGRQLFQNLRLAFAYLLLVHLPLVVGAAVIPLLGKPLLYLPIHIVWLELAIHPAAMLGFQDLPPRGPLAAVERHRSARFFTTRAWMAILLVGGFACAAVVAGYLLALGADQDVEHARAMALAIQLLCCIAFTAALSGLRRAAPRWIAAATLVSLGLLVQVPALSAWLHLRPLHLSDWAAALLAAAAAGAATRWLLLSVLANVRHRTDAPRGSDPH